MKRALLHLCCIFLLLFAQQVGLTHFTAHAPEQTPFQHGGKGHTSQSSICGFHGELAQVMGGVHASVRVEVASACVTEYVASRRDLWVAVFSLAPPSRGPPSLL